jgi:hypothetical protein
MKLLLNLVTRQATSENRRKSSILMENAVPSFITRPGEITRLGRYSTKEHAQLPEVFFEEYYINLLGVYNIRSTGYRLYTQKSPFNAFSKVDFIMDQYGCESELPECFLWEFLTPQLKQSVRLCRC